MKKDPCSSFSRVRREATTGEEKEIEWNPFTDTVVFSFLMLLLFTLPFFHSRLYS